MVTLAPMMSRAPLRRPQPVDTSSHESGPPIRLWVMCSKARLLMSSTPLNKQRSISTQRPQNSHKSPMTLVHCYCLDTEVKECWFYYKITQLIHLLELPKGVEGRKANTRWPVCGVCCCIFRHIRLLDNLNKIVKCLILVLNQIL